MNLFEMNRAMAPKKPYIMKRGKDNKYVSVATDGHRVLRNGSIVVRTVSVRGFPADKDYDKETIKQYERDVKSFKEYKKELVK